MADTNFYPLRSLTFDRQAQCPFAWTTHGEQPELSQPFYDSVPDGSPARRSVAQIGFLDISQIPLGAFSFSKDQKGPASVPGADGRSRTDHDALPPRDFGPPIHEDGSFRRRACL